MKTGTRSAKEIFSQAVVALLSQDRNPITVVDIVGDVSRRPMLTPFVVAIGSQDTHVANEEDLFGVLDSGCASSECEAVPKGAIPFYAFAH